MPNIFNISSSLPFLDSLAQGVLKKFPDLEKITVYVPSKRAIRPLAEAFLKHSGQAVVVLPKIQALGDIDEDEFAISFNADIPDAIGKAERIYSLAKLIHQNMPEMHLNFVNSVAFAKSLIKLIDELQNKDIPYSALDNVVPDEFAEHWQITLDFLKIISDKWEKYLAENNLLEPVKHRNMMINALADFYRANPPAHPVIIAGTTGTIPATLNMISAIMDSPNGYLIIDGLDRNLAESDFAKLEDTHPQFNLARLLLVFKTSASEVAEWQLEPLTARQKLISTALYPTEKTAEWQGAKFNSNGISLLECENTEQESTAIAMILREALENKKSAIVVTTDRKLAQKIRAKMKIWDVDINDSAGLPLIASPNAKFMLELADMVASNQAPAQVLSFFKHPFIAPELKTKIREIEKDKLRGVRIDGFDIAEFGIKFDGIKNLHNLFAQETAALSTLLKTHIAAAGEIAGEQLFKYASGIELEEFLNELEACFAEDYQISPNEYVEVFRQFISTKIYRESVINQTPVSILTPIEARLVQADIVIVASMNEGSFPELPPADSFMNQQIRKKIGLDLLTQKIGKAAHDFELLANSDRIILTRSQKQNGSPTVESRFIKRLKAVADLESGARYKSWVKKYFDAITLPAPRPEPRPTADARPKKLSATKITKLMRDPYVIYASEVLQLKKLDDIDQDISAADFGNFIHNVLEEFCKNYDGELDTLIAIGKESFKNFESREGAKTFWWPKFLKVADWFIVKEKAARTSGKKLEFEVESGVDIAGVKITAKADRVEIGEGITIIDYKTGTPPSKKDVSTGIEPQLTVEALIFESLNGKKVEGLEYWKLDGKDFEQTIFDEKKVEEMMESDRKSVV